MSEEACTSAADAARRDLIWAVRSPVLCGQAPPYFEDWARQDFDALVLSDETLQLRRIPIGRYFERLVQEWLSTQESVSKLVSNLPVRSATATLGEVDLLFAAHGKSYHWELAIKFYLGTGDRLSCSSWFGPQGRDRLDLKLNKLETHQLRLLETPEGKAAATKHGHASTSSYALIKGYLFHPFADWAAGLRPVPPEVNAKHAHGWWLHHRDLEQVRDRSQHWTCLRKADWLAPAQAPTTIRSSELVAWAKHYFASEERPPMLVALDDAGREMERGFVVPDNWAPSTT